ncbi:PepSY-like domain-containing protein [uncultured Pontibacter sp.]|uniref:PepSY-like domain-containing protein n=1 Tax=uncultured Pontibacter sp. TaxID=453356 RepID=UPI00260A2D2B|nr:PepSY-like domain-containing protein [uncultured Pontibacter sp.]
MKAAIIAFALMGSGAFWAVNAQDLAEKDVPQAVKTALAQKYANATDLDWEKSGSNYEADFDVNKVDHTVILDPSGKIVMAKRDIDKKDLPQTINNAIAQKYKGMRLDDIEVVERDGKSYYQVELDEKGNDRHLVFSSDGNEVTEPTYWD